MSVRKIKYSKILVCFLLSMITFLGLSLADVTQGSSNGTNVTNGSTVSMWEKIFIYSNWTESSGFVVQYNQSGSDENTTWEIATGNWTNYTLDVNGMEGGKSLGMKIFVWDTVNGSTANTSTGTGYTWQYIVDDVSPDSSNINQNITNSSNVSSTSHISFSVQWNDNVELSNYWFYNGTHNMTSEIFSTGNWSNTTWNTTGLSKNETYTPYFYVNDTSGYENSVFWEYEIDGYLPLIRDYHLNDSYININESVMLCVNSTDNVLVSSVKSELKLSNGSYFNFSLTELANGTWHYNFTKSDLGNTEDQTGLINVTNIFSTDSSNNGERNTTSLSIDYSRTKLTIRDHPDPAGNVSDSITFESDYETTENNDIELNCTLGIWYRTNGTMFTYLMNYGSNHTYVRNVTGWDLGGYGYNISCTNNSYESQWLNGGFELVSPSGWSGPSGGGGEKPEKDEEEDVTGCGDNICDQNETIDTCPEDCEVDFSYVPSRVSFKNVRPGDVSSRTLEFVNPSNGSIVIRLDIIPNFDDSYRWAYFGVEGDTKKVQYLIDSNNSQDAEVTISVPRDTSIGRYGFYIRVSEENKTSIMVPVDVEVYVEKSDFGILMEILKNEHKVRFDEGKYLLIPPLFMGNYFSWRWIYLVYLLITIIGLGIIIKLISLVWDKSKKKEVKRGYKGVR